MKTRSYTHWAIALCIVLGYAVLAVSDPIRRDFNVASGGKWGSKHNSPEALKSTPFRLPVQSGYTVCIEPDRDSNVAWTDSFHVALLTAPAGSIASEDSVNTSYNAWKWVLVKSWTILGHKASIMCEQFYYPPVDSITASTGAGTDQAGDSIHTWKPVALSAGIGRFVLSGSAADTLADAAFGVNVYLISKEDY